MNPRRAPKTAPPLALEGSLWISAGGESLGGHGRVALLQAIAEHGSITQGAKAFGMSYKAAWDAIDTMNNLAGEPLVETATGGRGGGATRLTPRGRQLVDRFNELMAIHHRFVRQLGEQALDLDRELSLLRMLNMKTSARNQFVGQIKAIRRGAVNDEVILALPGGARIAAVITHESTESLGLQPGSTAIALIKASSIILMAAEDGARLSARNQLPGVVAEVVLGAVNGEVLLDVEGCGRVAAIVTRESVAAMGLAPGVRVTAVFKASSVILAVLA
jgi:molybdate transport system regulatory protein